MNTTLLNMTEDTAVVADNLREFSRKDVEEERNTLTPALADNRKRLEELESERAQLLEIIPQQEDRLGLLDALHNMFEQRFPAGANEGTAKDEEKSADDNSNVVSEEAAEDNKDKK